MHYEITMMGRQANEQHALQREPQPLAYIVEANTVQQAIETAVERAIYNGCVLTVPYPIRIQRQLHGVAYVFEDAR